MDNNKKIKFIDLFAGIGGIRKGLELACADRGITAECVFTSEIKPYAVEVLKQNHPNEGPMDKESMGNYKGYERLAYQSTSKAKCSP